MTCKVEGGALDANLLRGEGVPGLGVPDLEHEAQEVVLVGGVGVCLPLLDPAHYRAVKPGSPSVKLPVLKGVNQPEDRVEDDFHEEFPHLVEVGGEVGGHSLLNGEIL